jgi:hypothetical protein
VKRVLIACLLPALVLLLQPVDAAAADEVQPFRTVVDAIVPVSHGLSITGGAGGCDLLLDNQSSQDVILFDMSQPPKANRFPAPPPSNNPRPPLAVHLTGAWPCVNLPSIQEDQRWNHQAATVLTWSLRGQVGALAFQLKAHTEYDPALDPTSEWMLYLRIGGGILIGLAIILTGPWLLSRRREILGSRPAQRPVA